MLPLWQQILIRNLFHYSGRRVDEERAYLAKHDHVPKFLYKYRQFIKTHVDAAEQGELWLSAPEMFNDPFDTAIYFHPSRIEVEDLSPDEFLAAAERLRKEVEAGPVSRLPDIRNPIRLGDWFDRTFQDVLDKLPPGEKEAFREFVRKEIGTQGELQLRRMSNMFRKGFSVLSLSANARSVLMWSHYADSHRGFCLEYDFGSLPFESLHKRVCFPVFYRRKRTDASRYFAKGMRDFNRLFGQYLCMLKSEEWAYEQEWRMIVQGGPPNEPLNMHPPTALILGANAAPSHCQWAADFCAAREIPLRIATQNLHSFAIDISTL